MAYFAQFPFIDYEFTDGIRTLKDISIRPDFIQRVIDDHSNYEFYTVREGDSPETLAYDFYGDASLHWVIMLANDILNVTSDWPLTTGELDKFLLNEYRMLADSEGTLHRLSDGNVRERVTFKGVTPDYTGTVIQDGVTLKIRPAYFDDANGVKYPFNSVVDNPDQDKVPRNVQSVSIFEREVALNDGKRNIIIVKQRVINDIQTELRKIANG